MTHKVTIDRATTYWATTYWGQQMQYPRNGRNA
jgi:hypothetical protein